MKLPYFRRMIPAGALAALLVFPAAAATLPDGPGKAVLLRVCAKCHSVDQATSLRQDRDDWTDTITKMVSMGAQGSDEELNQVLEYLAKNFGPEAPAPINVNKADAVELESSLVLTKSEATALIQYRTSNGSFKTIDDLKKVPGLDFKKIEAKKDRISF